MFQLNSAQATLIKIVDTWAGMLREILNKFDVKGSIEVNLNKDDMNKLTGIPGENNLKERQRLFAAFRNNKQFEDNLKIIKRKRNE